MVSLKERIKAKREMIKTIREEIKSGRLSLDKRVERIEKVLNLR